jgi:hypothetical protein
VTEDVHVEHWPCHAYLWHFEHWARSYLGPWA